MAETIERHVAWLAPGWWARPRLTVLFFVVTALSALFIAYRESEATWLMAFPFSLLFLNLAAVIATNLRFRADLPLLVLHLALLALVLLFIAGRLTYLEGRATITQDSAFTGTFQLERRGPLHPDRLADLRFMNAGITEVYPKLNDFRHTYNSVIWWDESGVPRMAEIGDDKPLILMGYRIFTSRNRGVAPVFRWQPALGGPSESGSMQLGQSMGEVFENATSLKLPNGQEAWIGLEAKAEAIPAKHGERTDMGVYEIDHVLVLRIGDSRHELRIGDSIVLEGGTLTYVRIQTWMGYRIAYDPTTPWIAATLCVAVFSLVWFYLIRVFSRPIPGLEASP
jgi:hypothetical protein